MPIFWATAMINFAIKRIAAMTNKQPSEPPTPISHATTIAAEGVQQPLPHLAGPDDTPPTNTNTKHARTWEKQYPGSDVQMADTEEAKEPTPMEVDAASEKRALEEAAAAVAS